MNNNVTDISFVLDRSGSMFSVREDTIGGVNQFLKAQQAATGEANLTLAQFDHQYEIVHNGLRIQDVPELKKSTFVPRGQTALFDAIGKTIIATGARLEKLPEAERPVQVIFVILTDGMENHSTEFTADKIKSMIQHQSEVYNWDFVFLGANQDAICTGTAMGIHAGNAMDFAADEVGMASAFDSISDRMCEYRNVDACATMKTAFFSDDDREKQKQSKTDSKKKSKGWF
jgi:hypothetical protein